MKKGKIKQTQEQPGYWSILPASVRYDDKISDFAKILFSEISALANKYGYCFATNAFFAELYGKNPTWVSETISSLEVAGHIKTSVDKRNYQRKIWIVTPLRLNPNPPSVITEAPPSGKAEENNTSINKTSSIASDESPAVEAPKKKKPDDSKEPMTLQQFLESCKASNHRHIQIIGNFADEAKYSFTTKGQWRLFIQRHVRPARQLSEYTDDQIAKAVKKIYKDQKERPGFLEKWGLETILKYLK